MGGQHPPPTKKAFRVVAGIDHTRRADSISAREGLRLPHTTMGGQHPPPTKKSLPGRCRHRPHVGADSISAREGLGCRTQPWVGSTRPLQRKPSGDSVPGVQASTTRIDQHPPLQRKPGSVQARPRGGFHIRPGRLAAAAHNHGWAAPAPYKESLPGRCRHRPHVGADSISAREGLRCRTQPWVGSTRPYKEKAFRVVAGIDHT